jgi:2-C-methyl-D-erythritol 4-phosphate cytidylyltransferase
MKVSAIIPAAGVGQRFDVGRKKQFFEFNAAGISHPVLYYTLRALAESAVFTEFVIGASTEDADFIRSVALEAGISEYELLLSSGGIERMDTVFNAVSLASGDYVLIHDAVRPFVTADMIMRVIEAAKQDGGAICGIYSRDTVKRTQDGLVVDTIPRSEVFLAHTPQVFHKESLLEAMRLAKASGHIFTDEAAVFEHAGRRVRAVETSPDNIKLTVQADLEMISSLITKYFN